MKKQLQKLLLKLLFGAATVVPNYIDLEPIMLSDSDSMTIYTQFLQ